MPIDSFTVLLFGLLIKLVLGALLDRKSVV